MTGTATPSESRRVPPGNALRQTRLIVRLGPGDPARMDAVADTLAGNGIRALALGPAAPGALAAAARLAARLPAECEVGLDAVATPDDVVRAAEAGARFIMAPYLAAEVIHTARGRGLAGYPGALTPAEIHLAWRAGASAVQLFPAGPLGPGHLAAVREQLPEIPLIAAGGIACADVAGWLEAGAAGVVLGGAFLGDALSPGGDLAALAERTRRVCAAAAGAVRQIAGFREIMEGTAPDSTTGNETPMTLKEQLQADVKAHMKAGNRTALMTVRNVLGEIETREKSGKTPVELDDAQVVALLQKEAAKRRDTAGIYLEAGEQERGAAEVAEAEIIEAYLPEPLTRADVESIVDGVITELTADGTELSMRQMGAVMKPVTAKVAGRFDGKAVSEIVRSRLA